MEAKIQQLAQEFKTELQKLYGNRFDKLILYGSYARGDFHEDSDVDFLIILNDEIVKSGTEVRNIGKISSNLSLKYNFTLQSLPTSNKLFTQGNTAFYRNIHSDGILL
jgi:uncharacterized protein